MYLPETYIFEGISRQALDHISKIAVMESCERGTILFSHGDPANHFYIVVDGEVELSIGNGASSHYILNRTGDPFGWSSLVGQGTYSFTAQCLKHTRVVKMTGILLDYVFDEDPTSGRIFYKNVAKAVGQRWLNLHQNVMSHGEIERDVSYGTGQMMSAGEA